MASTRQLYIKDRLLFQLTCIIYEEAVCVYPKPMKEGGKIFGGNGGKLEETHRKVFRNAAQKFRIF